MIALLRKPTPAKRLTRGQIVDEIDKRTVPLREKDQLEARGWCAITKPLASWELARAVEDMLGTSPFHQGGAVDFRICDNAIYRKKGEIRDAA